MSETFSDVIGSFTKSEYPNLYPDEKLEREMREIRYRSPGVQSLLPTLVGGTVSVRDSVVSGKPRTYFQPTVHRGYLQSVVKTSIHQRPEEVMFIVETSG